MTQDTGTTRPRLFPLLGLLRFIFSPLFTFVLSGGDVTWHPGSQQVTRASVYMYVLMMQVVQGLPIETPPALESERPVHLKTPPTPFCRALTRKLHTFSDWKVETSYLPPPLNREVTGPYQDTRCCYSPDRKQRAYSVCLPPWFPIKQVRQRGRETRCRGQLSKKNVK